MPNVPYGDYRTINKRGRFAGQLCRGYTLMELLIAVAVLGIIAGVAAPAFSSLAGKVNVRNVSDSFSTTLQQARAQAIKFQVPVTVKCKTTGQVTATSRGNCSNGWQVTVVLEKDQNKVEKVVAETALELSSNVSVDFSGGDITFNPSGIVTGYTGNMKVKGNDIVREISMTKLGRVSVDETPRGTE